ncbi:MAG: glycosyl hydrolase, partial [Pedobacter sp.]
GGFKSTTEKPAKISILENGPLVVSVKIESEIAGNPVFQIITLKQGQPLIDLQLQIDWKQNEGIGEFEETKYQDTALRKAFYNDKYKLLTLFPLALKNQKIFKDAPFDVTESKLDNTFFGSWDSIKNNIVLSWVDVMDGEEKYGMTMFTDHTTSYAHGKDFPLGLTTQYSGQGLWGRNYRIESATKINYQLLPHQGNWQKTGVSYQNEQIKEPLQVVSSVVKPSQFTKSLMETSAKALEITSATYDGEDLYVRIFNAAKTATNGKIKINFEVQNASFVALNGDQISAADLVNNVKGTKEVTVNLKPFGITTLKISRK